MALADISVFMIRASYVVNMAESRCGERSEKDVDVSSVFVHSGFCLSSIADIKMDVAVPESVGSKPALEVEQCACPQGYRGPSCQVHPRAEVEELPSTSFHRSSIFPSCCRSVMKATRGPALGCTWARVSGATATATPAAATQRPAAVW